MFYEIKKFEKLLNLKKILKFLKIIQIKKQKNKYIFFFKNCKDF